MIRSSNHRRGLIEALTQLVPSSQTATQELDEAAAERLGLNRTDLKCLGHVVHLGAISASQLAERVGLTRGSMTTALDRLEAVGFVRRTGDPEDRRSVKIEPTAAAKKAIVALYGPIGAEGVELLDGYSTAELKTIRRFMEEMTAHQQRHAARIRAMKTP